MDRSDSKDRSFSPKEPAAEHAEDERLALDLAQQARTLWAGIGSNNGDAVCRSEVRLHPSEFVMRYAIEMFAYI